MKTNKRKGFTLIEVLAVISIILILIGLISPAISKARQQAKINETKARIGSFEVAINMYYTDQGTYPATLNALTAVTAGHGPYLDLNTSFNDSWGIAYHYDSTNRHIYSNGPNKVDNAGAGDDIKNW
jgi:general secretion pathway protein G